MLVVQKGKNEASGAGQAKCGRQARVAETATSSQVEKRRREKRSILIRSAVQYIGY